MFSRVALPGLLALTLASQAPRPQVSFRSRVDMVPVDVRVVDRDGRPVTDLKQQDFTIVEDGVPQTIRHFSTLAFGVEDSAGRPGPDVVPHQRNRYFLLLVGDGRMNGPSKELPAVIDFVRTRLLPQDQVALMAYNRAIDFTTDHAKVADALERMKAMRDTIESDREFHTEAGSLENAYKPYGIGTLPPRMQAAINDVFGESARSRSDAPVKAGEPDTDDRYHGIRFLDNKNSLRFTVDELDRNRLTSLAEYMAHVPILLPPFGNAVVALGYLRRFDGEKHMVVVSPTMATVPGQYFARAAGDARVVVDIVYTGGLAAADPARYVQGGNVRLSMPTLPDGETIFRQQGWVQHARFVTEETGGQAIVFRSGKFAFDRLDQATRSQYVLGYYPSNAAWNGKYRQVTVKVNRPGVTVQYRRGYYANELVTPIDRRALITQSRLLSAGEFQSAIDDIGVSIEPPVVRRSGSSYQIDVKGVIRPDRLSFSDADGRHVAAFDVVVFGSDKRNQVLGEIHNIVDLKLKDESYEDMQRDGVHFKTTAKLTGRPASIKVVVYDYAADLLGTTSVRLK